MDLHNDYESKFLSVSEEQHVEQYKKDILKGLTFDELIDALQAHPEADQADLMKAIKENYGASATVEVFRAVDNYVTGLAMDKLESERGE